MPNIIAKKLNITLDTIKQKLIYLKPSDFMCVVGDSVEITANIVENGLPKVLTGTTVRLVGVRFDSTYFEQSEKITIEDEINGVVKIYPGSNNLNVLGKVIFGLIVEDEDETINIQRFGFEITDSMANVIISESKDSIDTLVRLNNLLDKYAADLDSIGKKTDDLKIEVDSKVKEITEDFDALEDLIVRDVSELNDRINGVDNTIKYQLTKAIKLDVYRLVGSNFIYLQSETFNIAANELLKRSYIVTIGGFIDTNIYSSSTGILNFYKQNGKVYPSFLTLMDKVLGGKSLSASIVFGDLTGEILPTAMNFKLLVKSNLLKSTNLDNEVYCYLTPIGNQL